MDGQVQNTFPHTLKVRCIHTLNVNRLLFNYFNYTACAYQCLPDWLHLKNARFEFAICLLVVGCMYALGNNHTCVCRVYNLVHP